MKRKSVEESVSQTSSVSPFERKQGKINFQKELDDNDLLCCVCWEPLTAKIFQCLLGSHNVCESCKDNIKNSGKNACPLDRTPGGFIPNPKLEKEVALLTIPCVHDGCLSKILPWMLEDHVKECEFAPFKCPLCFKMVLLDKCNSGSFGKHLQNDCRFTYCHLNPILSTSTHVYQIPEGNRDKVLHFIHIDDSNYIIIRYVSTSTEIPIPDVNPERDVSLSSVNTYQFFAVNLSRKKFSNSRNFRLLYYQDFSPVPPPVVDATVSANSSEAEVPHVADRSESYATIQSVVHSGFPFGTLTSIQRRMMLSMAQSSPSMQPSVFAISASPTYRAQLDALINQSPSYLSISDDPSHGHRNSSSVTCKTKSSCSQILQVPCWKFEDEKIKTVFFSCEVSDKRQYILVSNAFSIGDMLDALDTRNMWLEAVVFDVKDDMILIHYPQWSTKWDVWVNVDSDTIAPHRSHTTVPNYNPNYTGN